MKAIPANACYLMVAPDVAAALARRLPFGEPSQFYITFKLDILVNEDLESGTFIALDANMRPITITVPRTRKID